MITTLSFKKLDNSILALNTDPPGYPVDHYLTTVVPRQDTGRQRMEQLGVWPTLSYEDSMEIEISGEIFGTDSSDYTTRRLALVNAFRTGLPPTVPKHGSLIVRYDGQGEDWITDVIVTMFSAPRDAASGESGGPARGPFAISLMSWTPYFLGVSSGTKKYDA